MIDWNLVRSELAGQLAPDLYELCILRTRFAEGSDGMVTLTAPNAQAQAWLSMRLDRIIRRQLSWTAGRPVKVEYVV